MSGGEAVGGLRGLLYSLRGGRLYGEWVSGLRLRGICPSPPVFPSRSVFPSRVMRVLDLPLDLSSAICRARISRCTLLTRRLKRSLSGLPAGSEACYRLPFSEIGPKFKRSTRSFDKAALRVGGDEKILCGVKRSSSCCWVRAD